MTRIMKKLFGQRSSTYAQAETVNHEGFPAWLPTLRERYVQVLLTNTLSHTFYASQGDNYAATLAAHQEMFAADPQWAARALVYAREKGTMRTQPIIGLVYVSTIDPDLFRRIFKRIILTPGDLQDFVQIVRSKQIRPGMGRVLKETVNQWLLEISEYHVIKYGGTSPGNMTLRDVLRLTHPQPLDERTSALFTYVVDRNKWRNTYADQAAELLPQINALELLKRTNDSLEQRVLIEQGRLPYEIVTGVLKPDLDLWRELMQQMPYFALLRHLVTLQRAGVLQDPEAAQYVAERLTNMEAMRKAKVLPFRLHAAWVMFKAETKPEQIVKAALEQALEAAFINMPQLEGRIVIAPDVSGSMDGSINYPSKVRYIDIAGIFAGALIKGSDQAMLLPFDTGIREIVQPTRTTPVIETTEQIAKLVGGGTALSAPVSHLLLQKQPIDVFIGITDNMEWATDSYGNTGFLDTWRHYRAQIAPEAQAFLITIASYGQQPTPPDEPGVHYIYGWADHVPAYIAQTLAGYTSQVHTIEHTEI